MTPDGVTKIFTMTLVLPEADMTHDDTHTALGWRICCWRRAGCRCSPRRGSPPCSAARSCPAAAGRPALSTIIVVVVVVAAPPRCWSSCRRPRGCRPRPRGARRCAGAGSRWRRTPGSRCPPPCSSHCYTVTLTNRAGNEPSRSTRLTSRRLVSSSSDCSG